MGIAKRTSRKFFIINILVAALLVFSMLGGITTNFENGVSTQTTSSEPALSSKLLSPMNTNQSTLGINPFYLYSNEPAPMGLADFGVDNPGEGGIGETDYAYNTTSFLGAASINSLSAYNNTTINHQMTFQFNVNLAFNYSGNLYVYWVQDVAFVNTSNNCIYFIDNIWNISSPDASMQNSTFTGNGALGNSSGTYYYYSVANCNLPGNFVKLQYPSNVQFMMNSTVNRGVPEVNFMYNDGYGWVTYDNVLFKFVSNLPESCDYGFVVNGYNYEPDGYSFYDAELILGGPGDGSSTSDIQSNVNLTIQYWNGHNYQEISNAFNFGTDTAETIGNTVSAGYYSTYTGNLFEEVTAGSGGCLQQVYNSSDIAFLNISMPFSSGTVYVNGSAHDFVGGDINLTLGPGHYQLKIYNNSVLFNTTTVNLSAGEYLPLEVNESLVTFTDTGLPSGTIWYVNITNGIKSGPITGSTYSLELTNGSYSYIIATNDKIYSPSPYIGSFKVNGTSLSKQITFSMVTYPVMFTESGLPSGITWYVNITGQPSSGPITGGIYSLELTNGTYSYSIQTINKAYEPSTSSGSFTVNGSNITEKVTFTPVKYSVTFTETGLPSGTEWYVNFSNGQSLSSTKSTISFNEFNGSYSYTIGTTNKTYSASGGSITVNGRSLSVQRTFSKVAYSVTFTEKGLPSGSVWYVNLTNGIKSGPITGSSYSISLANGTYNYTIATSNKFYSFSPSSGTFTVNGKSVSQSVTFSKIIYTISGYVLPANASLMFYNISVSVNPSGYYNISISPGTYIVSVTVHGYFSYAKNIKITKNKSDLNFTLINEPKPTSSITKSNVTANGYNVVVSNIASSNGSISVNYTATKNGTITVALPYSQMKNVTINDLQSSRLYINGTQYENFTVAISSSGTAILTVYNLTGDPTLVWLYSPAASPPAPPSPTPKPTPVSSAISSIEIYAIVGIVVAIVAVVGAVMVMKRRK